MISAPNRLRRHNASRDKAAWPRLVLAALLLAVVAWNVSVIRDRYAPEHEAADSTEPSAHHEGIERPPAAVADHPPPPAPDPTTDPLIDPITDPITDATETRAPGLDPASALDPVVLEDHPARAVMVPGATVGTGHALSARVVAGTIEPGQAVATAIMETGLTGEQAHRVVTALQGTFDFRRARPGEGFRIKLGPEGELDLFDYERSPIESYLARRENGELVGFKREIQPRRELVRIEGEIKSSLFAAVDAAGANASLGALLANVLAWDVDFYRDTRRGDTFTVVVERFHHRGRHLRYGEILAAEYEGAFNHVRLFRYEREEGRVGYYDEEGQSAQRTFLRAPLQVVRVTSGFGMRRHPILGYSRQHRGVDYGAPTGTPVWAVGDGRVTSAGRKGAYGNLVIIRHANGYTTWYAHLSRINVRVGERVRQQQVIGRVGATGMATGPHLHYEIRHHGRHINPLTLRLPPREPLPASILPDYLSSIESVRAILDGELEPSDVSLDEEALAEDMTAEDDTGTSPVGE